MAYSRARYFRHHLSEGAIVAELRSLLAASIGLTHWITNEQPYAELCRIINRNQQRARGRPKSADLAVQMAGTHVVTDVIEVKRYEGAVLPIKDDLYRLADLRSQRPTIKCWLVVTSERRFLPKIFQRPHVRSHGTRELPGVDMTIRRRCAALHSLKSKSKGIYACVVEVKGRRIAGGIIKGRAFSISKVAARHR
jgi:hypothetical protein